MRVLVLIATLAAASPAKAASWDMLAGGVPGKDFLLTVDLGFASLPKVALNYGILNRFSIGIAAGFDFAAYTFLPSAVFSPAAGVSFPLRIEAYRGGRVSIGVKFEPGLAIAFAGATRFGMQLGAGFNVGYWVVDKFMVGGGLDIPTVVYFTPGVAAVIPLLFGPILEFHAGRVFAMGLDLKIGPGIRPGAGVEFAMKMLFTLGFHF